MADSDSDIDGPDSTPPARANSHVVVGLLLSGLVLIVVGVTVLGRNVLFMLSAVPAPGEVVELLESRSTDGSSTYRPKIRYPVEGDVPRVVTTFWSTDPPSFRVGEGVVVYYDPANPNHTLIDSHVEKWLGGGMLIGLGNLLAILGLIIAARRGRSNSTQAE